MCKPGMKLLEKGTQKPAFDNPAEIIKVNLNWAMQNILVKLVKLFL